MLLNSGDQLRLFTQKLTHVQFSPTILLKIHVHEWNDLQAFQTPFFNAPLWVSLAFSCSTTHLQTSFTFAPARQTTMASTHYLSLLALHQSLC